MVFENVTTINLTYDTRLRAGFNMLKDDEDIFPEKYRVSRDGNQLKLWHDEYRQLVKKYMMNKIR